MDNDNNKIGHGHIPNNRVSNANLGLQFLTCLLIWSSGVSLHLPQLFLVVPTSPSAINTYDN